VAERPCDELFRPHLTPSAMLREGVFGGSYFHGCTVEDVMGLGAEHGLVERDMREFDKRHNRYGVRAGQSFAEWTAAGWIFPEDPLGWFHWYCRYHAGRRHERDPHQIRRWVNYGARWGRFARGQMISRGDASSVVKQGLLQWAYEPMVVLHEAGGTMYV